MSKKYSLVITGYGKKLEIELPITTTGNDILKLVCEQHETQEYWWFGLFGLDKDDCDFLLDSDLTLKKQRIMIETDGKVHLKFRILFFPENINAELIQFSTKKLFFVATVDAIGCEDLFVTASQAASLSALYLQYKKGDYNEDAHDEKTVMESVTLLLPKRLLTVYQASQNDWYRQVTEVWKTLINMYKLDAIDQALNEMQELAMYGTTYFEITNKKGTLLNIGIQCSGINIYSKEDLVTPKVGFMWSEVEFIKYEKCKFTIQPRDGKWKLVLFSNNYKKNALIMDLCIGNYKMNRKRKIKPTPETQRELDAIREGEKAGKKEREDFIKEVAAKAKKRLQTLENAKNDIEMQRVIVQLNKIEEIEKTNDEDFSAVIYDKMLEVNRIANRNSLENFKIKMEATRIAKTPLDNMYEINKNQHADKFATLRFVCSGNTRARIDQFECL